jgi:hypothetical protein
MPRSPLVTACAALAAGWQMFSTHAFAHIELQSPLNRYSDIKVGDNKACPCGSGSTNRSCRKPEEFSDPDRAADRATTFAPGAEITVRFDEYVGHSGRYRIAFDPDGADLEDFNQHILMDEPDPSGNVGNLARGSMWEFQVTLPDMTCDNCTLQLIQVMDGNTTDPVLDPVLRGGTYFQCADLILADGAPANGLPPAAPTDHPGQRGRPQTSSATTQPRGIANTSAMSSGGTETMGAAATDVELTSADEEGGCSVAVTGPRPAEHALAALGFVLAAFGRIRLGRRRPVEGCFVAGSPITGPSWRDFEPTPIGTRQEGRR